jgi:probable HAF family extracellular repeat protein
MMNLTLAQSCALSGLAALFLGSSRAEAGAMYAATALSQPVSINDAPAALGINNRGQVAGYYGYTDIQPAGYSGAPYPAQAGFVYGGNNGGNVTFLGTTPANTAPGPDATSTNLWGINDSGQVVGRTVDAQGNVHGFVYGGGQYTTLPGNPVAINNAGQVAGNAFFANGQFTNQPGSAVAPPDERPTHSYIATGGVLKDLGILPGSTATTVSAINDSGQAAGVATFALPGSAWSTTHAFFFDGHTLKDIGTLGGVAPYGTYVSGMNNRGDVIGSSSPAANPALSHAFVSHQGGPLIDLGTLPGGTYSYANGINNLGQIVGTSAYISGYKYAYGYAPFLYQDGKMTDLNALIDPLMGVTISQALKINDAGQIAALGYYNYQPGLWRLFVLTPEDQPQPTAPGTLIQPVPEPTSMALQAAVLAGAAGAAWRRRRGRSAQ